MHSSVGMRDRDTQAFYLQKEYTNHSNPKRPSRFRAKITTKHSEIRGGTDLNPSTPRERGEERKGAEEERRGRKRRRNKRKGEERKRGKEMTREQNMGGEERRE